MKSVGSLEAQQYSSVCVCVCARACVLHFNIRWAIQTSRTETFPSASNKRIRKSKTGEDSSRLILVKNRHRGKNSKYCELASLSFIMVEGGLKRSRKVGLYCRVPFVVSSDDGECRGMCRRSQAFYTGVSQLLWDRGPVCSFFHKTRARSQQIYS
jgi:hypothetical protein